MKKKYIEPVVEKICIQITGLLAVSTLSITGDDVENIGDLLSREDALWLEDDL
jgi:hypothetical protein